MTLFLPLFRTGFSNHASITRPGGLRRRQDPGMICGSGSQDAAIFALGQVGDLASPLLEKEPMLHAYFALETTQETQGTSIAPGAV